MYETDIYSKMDWNPLEESTSTWKTDHNTLKVDPEKGALKVQNYGLHWTLEKFSIIREVD